MGPRRQALALALVCVAATAGCATSQNGAHPEAGAAQGRFFAPRSVWNRPLASKAAPAPDSAALVAELRRQLRASQAWINTDTYSVPIVTVGRDQRRVRVRLDTDYPPLARDFARVPIPRTARPAAGGDRHLVVWQPSTDTMWEFWLLTRRADGWHARWGARIARVSRSRGVIPAPEGATASGLPLAGGLITLRDLRRGRIDHAVAVGLPAVRAGIFRAPADRTDGKAKAPSGIPMGTRFRLDPRVRVDALGLPPVARMIARAVQRYGMIVRDTSGVVSLYAQAPPPGDPDAYHPFFRGAYPDQLLARFPWRHLQVVRAPEHAVNGG